MGNNTIEIVDKYKYLGVFFSKSRSFLHCRKHIVEQARKAMYLLFSRINNFYLPIDLQLKLFDHTVLPILTYACEIWGYENLDMIEKVHTEFLRNITKSRKSTSLYMIYAELGRSPIEITIQSRIINFWNRIICGKKIKTIFFLYQVLLCTENLNSKWIAMVKDILSSVGRNDLWLNQNNISINNVNIPVKQTLLDQFYQKWHESLNNSMKGKHYCSFKDAIALENYFCILPRHLSSIMVRFRTSNHKLLIETGRWYSIDLDDRKCPLCTSNSLGDECHFLLECIVFSKLKGKNI